jgi:TPR repeat protein
MKEGCGVPQDEKQAVEWFRQAAQAGHPNAAEALKRLNR